MKMEAQYPQMYVVQQKKLWDKSIAINATKKKIKKKELLKK